MQIHHPTAEQLAEYASGSLRLSHALCISAHTEHCSACRQQVQKLSGLGGGMLAELEVRGSSEQLSPLKDKLFAMLDDVEPEVEAEPPIEPALGINRPVVPKALQQFIPRNYQDIKWSKVSRSFKIATLLKDKDGAQIALSCVQPGGRMPHHRHTGDELTVVLEGAFSDESGIYKKGDFISRDASHKHRPMVTRDAQCICLMVLDAPIEFTGWFTRLLNPLVKRNHAQG